jgi:hypothetical protein
MKASVKKTACGSDAESCAVGSATGVGGCDAVCASEVEAGAAQCPRCGAASSAVCCTRSATA